MIGYPNKKVIKHSINQNISNRGMNLEDDINKSNEYYLANDIAIIYKKPTPIQIVKVDYPSRNKAKIVEAYYKIPSTTDYNGVYRGKYIDFEAKQISSKISFPLAFIHKHQVDHLKNIVKHGGIGFVILRFSAYNETYLIDATKIVLKYENAQRRSLTYNWVKECGYMIKEGLIPRLNYIKVIDELYFEGE